MNRLLLKLSAEFFSSAVVFSSRISVSFFFLSFFFSMVSIAFLNFFFCLYIILLI